MLAPDVIEEISPLVTRVAVRSPTLPPATTTNALVVGRERVVVVEPAATDDPARAALDDVLARRVAEGGRIVGILSTHHHRDHVGSLSVLGDRWRAPVVAHELTAARVAHEVHVPVVAEWEGPLLGEGIALDEGLSIRPCFTPGHAPGHLVWVLPEAKLVYAGDMVAGEGTILVDPRDDGDMAAYLDSLRRLRTLVDGSADIGQTGAARGPEVAWRVVPSHGGVIPDAASLVDRYLAHRLAREAKVLASLTVASLDLRTLLERVYDDVPASTLPIAEGSLEAHLVKLAREGRISRRGRMVSLS